MTLEELRAMAVQVAAELLALGQSKQGALPTELRRRFIAVRAELFQRGIFDPVLARFDSATVPKASLQEIGNELAAVAKDLR